MNARRRTIGVTKSLGWLPVALLAFVPALSPALTPASFQPVRGQLTNEIALLSLISEPTRAERVRLNRLNRANDVLKNTAHPDGKALRLLNSHLQPLPTYKPALDATASNLVAVFNNEYNFIGGLILELPTTTAAEKAGAQYDRMARTAARLNQTIAVQRVGLLYDSSKARLDQLLFQVSEALIIPFPDDMVPNSVDAVVNGVNFSARTGLATENVFEARVTASNITINVSGIDLPRGVLFSIPNAQPGSFRYGFPDAASFVFRSELYTAGESSTAATSGAVYVSTTPTEVYGSFRCRGEGFEIKDGRFRITLSSAP